MLECPSKRIHNTIFSAPQSRYVERYTYSKGISEKRSIHLPAVVPGYRVSGSGENRPDG
jgi:hypothetical protein